MSLPSTERYFWSRVAVSLSDAQCWPWRGKTNNSGYGTFGYKNMLDGAHVWAWKFSGKKVPRGLCVLHHCDNRKCCNPDHMFVGTMSDNSRDSWSKGNNFYQKHPEARPRGENHANAKLSVKKVKQIKKWYRAKKFDQYELAKKFSVSQTLISHIIRGHGWKGVA